MNNPDFARVMEGNHSWKSLEIEGEEILSTQFDKIDLHWVAKKLNAAFQSALEKRVQEERDAGWLAASDFLADNGNISEATKLREAIRSRKGKGL